MENEKLQDFLDEKFYPALFSYIPSAFPEMEFTKCRGYWRTKMHIHGDASKKSKDQTIVHESYPYCMIDHNSDRKNLIAYAMERDGSTFWDALIKLCNICGLEPPRFDKEKYNEGLAQGKKMEGYNKRFKAALWGGSEGANEVLAYLRDTRKWTDEEIIAAELGYVDETIQAEPEPNVFKYTTEDGASIGRTHRLAIPYRTGGRIIAFKVRDIHRQDIGKYLNTKGPSKGAAFFGLPIGIKDLTIVEGELDALRAQVNGFFNIVATAGGGANERQIEGAIRQGCKRFTLLFDNDDRGQSFILPTIKEIEEQGGEAFVAALPEESKDMDKYLQSHTIKDLQTELDKAISAAEWRYNDLRKRCDTKPAKKRADYLAGVEEIISSCKEADKEVVYNLMHKDEEAFLFKVEDFKQRISNTALREAERRKKRLVDSAMAKIAACAKRGATEEGLAAIKQAAAAFEQDEGRGNIEQFFAPPASIGTYISEVQRGIPTGIKFKRGTQEERLTLNAGLTFVCANRGHGKTSFLLNLAINEATRLIRKNLEGSVLFFSYEIDRRRLYTDLLGVYVNDAGLNRSKNPQDAIISYFKGEKQWISGSLMEGDSITHYDNFEQKKDEFFKDYISSRKLVVVEEPFKVGALLNTISYYIKTKGRPTLICIDYAQLIYSEEKGRQRTEEIKQIVNNIKDFANKEGIPFVLAAQFNREVNSPASVDTKNIGEGGDFERIADTCIGIFNLKELHTVMGQYGAEETREARYILQQLGAIKYKEQQLEPINGKLYVKLMKRRYGFYPLDTILDWEGRTKHITLNDEEARFGIPSPTVERDLFKNYV